MLFYRLFMFLAEGQFGMFPASLMKALKPNEQVVLSWLWFHKNKSGKCFPSVKKLEEETGLSRRTIFRVFEILEDKNLILRIHRGENGKQKSNLYQLYLGKKEGCQSDTGGVSEWHTEPEPINQYSSSKEEEQPRAESSKTNEEKKKEKIQTLEFLKATVGVESFTETGRWSWIYLGHILKLGKKLGAEEVKKRLEVILGDEFKAQNCISLKYLYSQMKAFRDPEKALIKTAPKEKKVAGAFDWQEGCI